MNPIHIDSTNEGILHILQRNARTTIADIGRQVGRAESTIRERLAALETHGVIRGYHARVDPRALGYTVSAMITTAPDLSEASALKERLARLPNLRDAVLTTGDEPLLMNVVARDLSALERYIVERVAPLGLGRLNTEIVVRELLHDRPIGLHETTGPETESHRDTLHPDAAERTAAAPGAAMDRAPGPSGRYGRAW